MGPPTTEDEAGPSQGVPLRHGKTEASPLLEKIFHQLSDDEKEQAARASSYRYLVASTSAAEGALDRRDEHAKAMIGRYVTVEQKLHGGTDPEAWEAAACSKLRKTLEFRKEKRVDDIRLCFNIADERSDDGESDRATVREGLERRFVRDSSFVRGYTKDGCALIQIFPRNDVKWEEEYFIKGNIYMMERALACTERRTDGEKDKITVFHDYNGYRMKNNPPVMIIKHLLSNLRDHWPERIAHCFMVDAPSVFRVFWAIIKHFVDPITVELVHFISGEEQKKILREMISEDQAAPFMFDGGENGEEVDMKTFFYDTPFDHVYGEGQS